MLLTAVLLTPLASHASFFVHSWTSPHAEQTVVAVTIGSWSVATTSIPVETPWPVAGQLIMMIPTIFSSIRLRSTGHKTLAMA